MAIDPDEPDPEAKRHVMMIGVQFLLLAVQLWSDWVRDVAGLG
ncbi:hypothetical protein [Sinosporangium siamense]|uniref:Uncharacterized protein n=1 Tax=Sinosporangium siamense TaxID=1367973 RepID=A0A919RJN3_9ACTN|nr:hypothetical protein [Sinosporangium siamense]GII94868.1 hypothetical protein Ssi02_50990 [Sinosporangium siamense]